MNDNLVPIEMKKINIEVEGVTPLICNNFSEKIRTYILNQSCGCGGPRPSPETQFNEAKYLLPDGSYGFPAAGFKGGMVSAGRFFDGISMTILRSGLHVHSEGPNRLVRLTCSEPIMREDNIRNATGVVDKRYRPQFDKWSATVTVGYLSSLITDDQVISIMDAAGIGGIGEWRPSSSVSAKAAKAGKKGGDYGRFKVVNYWVPSGVEADELDARYEAYQIEDQESRDRFEAQRAAFA